ncbi:MAG: SHD1 domain-containing protein [Akkermansiaceae bacterium]
MKKLFLSGFLGVAIMTSVGARTWTDKKGRKIEAEYVSQTKDAVLLKLKNGKEVSVPFSNLSRADLNYLIEAEIAAAEKSKDKKPADGEMEKEGAPADGGAIVIEVADPSWDRPVLKEAVLKTPIEVLEEKRGEFIYFSSPNFRVVADGRVSSKAVLVMLEACELTKVYCDSLPFGLSNRFDSVDGKYEVHSVGEKDDWAKMGRPEASRSTFNPNTGQLEICLELFGLSSAGRGGESSMRNLAGQMILHVSRCMLPEVYERNFMDWFKEGFPNMMNMAVYEKGKLDFTDVIEETKDLLSGKGSGRTPIFKKEVEMPKVSDLITKSLGGVADAEGRRRLLAQSVLVMTYLTFLEDGGKATGLRQGLRYAHDFQKNQPKSIRYTDQEDLERQKAALKKLRDEMDDTALAMIFRKRPWDEVEADMTKLWGENGLELVFPGAKKD